MPFLMKTLHLPITLLALALLAGCGLFDDTPKVSQQQFLQQMQGATPPLVLDVRSRGEFRAGHIPGAVNLPVNDLARSLRSIERFKGKEVVVYCATGSRSRYAIRQLSSAGFKQVKQLEGDMRAWRGQRLPTERG